MSFMANADNDASLDGNALLKRVLNCLHFHVKNFPNDRPFEIWCKNSMVMLDDMTSQFNDADECLDEISKSHAFVLINDNNDALSMLQLKDNPFYKCSSKEEIAIVADLEA